MVLLLLQKLYFEELVLDELQISHIFLRQRVVFRKERLEVEVKVVRNVSKDGLFLRLQCVNFVPCGSEQLGQLFHWMVLGLWCVSFFGFVKVLCRVSTMAAKVFTNMASLRQSFFITLNVAISNAV